MATCIPAETWNGIKETNFSRDLLNLIFHPLGLQSVPEILCRITWVCTCATCLVCNAADVLAYTKCLSSGIRFEKWIRLFVRLFLLPPPLYSPLFLREWSRHPELPLSMMRSSFSRVYPLPRYRSKYRTIYPNVFVELTRAWLRDFKRAIALSRATTPQLLHAKD